MQEFVNVYTGKTITRADATDRGVAYDGKMMLVEIDTDGIIVYANRKFREMLEYEKEELVGLPYTISFHPDMPEGICRQAFDLAKEGKVWAGYAKTITRNGEYFWTAVCVQPKYEMNREVSGFIIRKKEASLDVINEVQMEFSKFSSLKMGDYKSEYCGEMHFSH